MKSHTEQITNPGRRYKHFKLPLLKIKREQSPNKTIRSHKIPKSQEINKSLSTRSQRQHDKQLISKLKLISLIKTDNRSLSAISKNEHQSQYRRITRSEIKSVRNIQNRTPPLQKKMITCPSDRQGLAVSKIERIDRQNCHIKSDYRNYVKSCRQKSTHRYSLTEKINQKKQPRQISKTIKSKTQNTIEDGEGFVTCLDNNIEEEIQNQQQIQTKQYERCYLKLKPQIRQKYSAKKQNIINSNFNQKKLMDRSIRGWTRYGKSSIIDTDFNDDIIQ